VAGERFSYRGQGFSLQREKNRFVLPALIRKTVKESSGKTLLCLAKHDRWKCLTGFGLSRVEDFDAEIEREEVRAIAANKPYDRDLRSMQLYGYFEVPFDGSGRFVLPDHLASLAGIENQIYFQGAGPFFTVWSPAVLAGMGEGWEGPQAACANYLKETARGQAA
jgi:MraZ protein